MTSTDGCFFQAIEEPTVLLYLKHDILLLYIARIFSGCCVRSRTVFFTLGRHNTHFIKAARILCRRRFGVGYGLVEYYRTLPVIFVPEANYEEESALPFKLR